MNAKKARLNRKVDRFARYVAREKWKEAEPPRYRVFKWRKWKRAEPK